MVRWEKVKENLENSPTKLRVAVAPLKDVPWVVERNSTEVPPKTQLGDCEYWILGSVSSTMTSDIANPQNRVGVEVL